MRGIVARSVVGVVLSALVIALPLAYAGRPARAQEGPGSAEELVGLWTARRWFGPHARGPLVIERTGETYTADMMGRLLTVRADGGELAFELPNGLGAFRGKLEPGTGIRGHWRAPPSNALLTGFTYVSPVSLEADGAGRWSGEVVPFDDVFTFHLRVERRPDGTLGAFLHNPERGFGAQADRLVREGDAVRLLAPPRDGEEGREVARGTYDPDAQVLTLAFPTRGGTYDFRRDDDESPFYPRGKHPGRYRYRPPPERDDGWPVGTLEAAGIDRGAVEGLVQAILDRPIESVESPQVHALLIARHGRLVLEEYFHGQHRDRLHETRSAAKSLTALVVGAAIEAGAPLRLSSPVYEVMNGGSFPAGLDPGKRAMTLEHLLTMSSGFHCDDQDPVAPGGEDAMLEQGEEPDYHRFTMAVPLATAPGEKAVYCSASANLALGMVGRATGESPLYAFDRLLAEPLGIRRYAWFLDPAGNPYGGGSVQLLPRDFLKLGQLMLQDRTWDGRRVLGRDFVARATRPQYHLRNIYYGYLWWIEDYPYKDRTVRTFSARGAGGQMVTVVPELDLAVAVMAANYSSRVQLTYTATLVPRILLPAVREPGDDPSTPVVEREYTSPYGRSPNGSRVAPPAEHRESEGTGGSEDAAPGPEQVLLREGIGRGERI